MINIDSLKLLSLLQELDVVPESLNASCSFISCIGSGKYKEFGNIKVLFMNLKSQGASHKLFLNFITKPLSFVELFLICFLKYLILSYYIYTNIILLYYLIIPMVLS